MPTICLNMIVKNESRNINRLLESVVNIIDCYCICDTGSTDNTIEIITNYFNNKNIHGKIIHEPFKNFAYNRNFALSHCEGMSDYILLLDADMVLINKTFSKKDIINYDTIYILQGNDSFYYKNVRIIRNNNKYKYVGVTHEFINKLEKTVDLLLPKDILFISDIGDGGSKENKFERDIKLLTDGINEEPNNDRYHFYLANSYYDLDKYDEAIQYYLKRINLGGWIDEIWYSYYRIGLIYKKLNKISDAIFYWMEGYNCIPDRLEGIYEIIKYYREISKHKICDVYYNIAKKVLEKSANRDHYLFLNNDVYTNKLFVEYTIFSAYIGNKNINNEIIEILNNSRDNSDRENLLFNMQFYKYILEPCGKIIMDNKILSKFNDNHMYLTSSSSCIIKNPKNTYGYIMNMRYVNYYIDDNGKYLNCEKNIVTQNKFLELDNNLGVLKEKLFDFNGDNRLYNGVEDIRFFNDTQCNKLIFIGTGYHINDTIGIVTGDYNIENNTLDYIEIVPNFNKSQCEKNWVFVDYKNSTHLIYDWCPLKICKINKENKILELIEQKNMPPIFKKARGSTNGFKYKDELWFVVHIVSYETPRHYYHMIVVFDEFLNLKKYSAPFKFEGESIEYCLGLVVEDERVLMTYSTWDRTTRIGIYYKTYINNILKYNK